MLALLLCALACSALDPEDVMHVTFVNVLKGPATLSRYDPSIRFEQVVAELAPGAERRFASRAGQEWTAESNGQVVFRWVGRESDGADQRVNVAAGVRRRTIASTLKAADDTARVDGGPKQDDVGCVDPVLVGDAVYVRALGQEGFPALSVERDGRVVAVHGTAGATETWRVETLGRDSGPLFPGDAVYLKSSTGRYVDAEVGRPLAARWSDRGSWQKFTLRLPRNRALCYGDVAYLQAHANHFVDVTGGKAQSRWKQRGEWQKLAFERKQTQPEL
ncbi:hypothetical protein M885DRAFT_520405 [Pelagophyceae sp. CCMP2097]|nr:hypothetical protein M885DRAFT_520405 [Pelagophyceae sp. CCMP2097]